ncbi:MAG: riboflavin synthase [Deltaproteobacteria bacterium]|nr:riboflavin synthase [Deltaproteobacteria bacterium]
MFTGLVEDAGVVTSITPRDGGRVLAVRTRIPLAEVRVGDSIAVDGVCLTAETVGGDVFTAIAGRETLAVTTLDDVRVGRTVHLERALAVGDRLGGHLVQGHVDGVGRVRSAARAGESWIVWVTPPPDLARYIAVKGSICIDGVSLTVNELDGDDFRVNLIPHTTAVTRLGDLRAGDRVNLETDVLAKYVERLLGRGPGLDADTLRRWGYPV